MNNNSNSLKFFIVTLVVIAVGAVFINRDGRLRKNNESENTTYSRIQYDRFSIEVNDKWNAVENEGIKCYISSDGKQVFAVSSVMSDFGDSAEKNLDSVEKTINGEFRTGLSDVKYDQNGIEFKTVYMLTTLQSYDTFVGIIFCEQKNIALLITATYKDDKLADSTYDDLTKMCDSIEFTDTPDIVTGKTFYMDMEKLTAELYDDGTFMIYSDQEDIDKFRISGTYEVYRGRDAVEKVTSMEEYGLTTDEQKRFINNNVEFWDDYYAVVLHVTEAAQDSETIESDAINLYVGFANEDHSSLVMTACNRFLNETWTYVE